MFGLHLSFNIKGINFLHFIFLSLNTLQVCDISAQIKAFSKGFYLCVPVTLWSCKLQLRSNWRPNKVQSYDISILLIAPPNSSSSTY